MILKPYQNIAIAECGEPLVPIPLDHFALVDPHPYVRLGAPYGNLSPYFVRQGVLTRLLAAQAWLRSLQPAYENWRIQIFDAYRPLAVQAYMVDLSFHQTVQAQGLSVDRLTEAERQEILLQVHRFWAVPSHDLATPPPHSTGAAIDVTLVDAQGQVLDMGSAIDEMSARSYPDYFDLAAIGKYCSEGWDSRELDAHQRQRWADNRQILKQALESAGFRQHLREWWHFSWGDQYWAWLENQAEPTTKTVAHYGRALTD